MSVIVTTNPNPCAITYYTRHGLRAGNSIFPKLGYSAGGITGEVKS